MNMPRSRYRAYFMRKRQRRAPTVVNGALQTRSLRHLPHKGLGEDAAETAVSTWLNAGAPSPSWLDGAGHSVEVLLTIYAKYIGGAARYRVKNDASHRPTECV
jgi:hypothetical protein